jgi:UDPglucose--hexose-1-phosphate uridylyltransferase
MQVGQIRLNKATREWVIYAPSRRKRPQDFQRSSQSKPAFVDRSHKCPFCPGNEDKSTAVLLEMANAQNSFWQTRVVPNKFPALTSDAHTERHQEGIYVTMPGYGRHEVVIESPEHHRDLATMPLEAMEIVVETYHKRYTDLMRVHKNMMAIIFRNHGERAGASLSHPHSQIIVTGIVPQNRRWREEEVQRYFDDWGRCVYCDILSFEMQDRRRLIQENDSFVAFVPFAADVPFEVWIMPKKHQADFGSVSDSEKADFAWILQNVLTRLYEKLHDPDYNYVINTAARYKAEEPQVHWYCQIRPRLTTTAGFEIGAGISINPSIPETDADFLNGKVEADA